MAVEPDGGSTAGILLGESKSGQFLPVFYTASYGACRHVLYAGKYIGKAHLNLYLYGLFYMVYQDQIK